MATRKAALRLIALAAAAGLSLTACSGQSGSAGGSGETAADGKPKGDITFLTQHAPFVGALETGQVTIRPETGDDTHFAVHGGFVEVSNDQVSLLTDVAEAASQIDVDRARAALANAKTALASDPLDPAALAAVKRAELRLLVAGATTD